MLQLTFYLVVSCLLVVLGETHDDFLVCKPIGSLFEMQRTGSNGNASALRGPAGPPGKRGIRGFPGPTGSVGPIGMPGIVNWTEVDARMEAKLEEKLSCPGIWFNKSCFWLPLTVANITKLTGKTGAEDLCRFHKGTLVDIESKEMYDVLYQYVQRSWSLYLDDLSFKDVHVWLASTYVRGTVRSSTGGPVYAKWRLGFPAGGTVITWIIAKDPSVHVTLTGFRTSSQSDNYNYPVPLCKIRI